MKIAAVGKGGSGKTTIAGTLARILAEDGIKVLAIDGDPNPNLALTLGISRDDAGQIKNIPASIMAVKEEPDGTRQLYMTVSENELMHEYGTAAPDDIQLIIMGQPPHGSAGSGCMCASHRAVCGLISEMSGYGDHTITDMEAGLEHLKRGTVRKVDIYFKTNEMPGQGGDCYIDQEPHWHVVGLEVNADHGADFKIDKQQQEILNRPRAFLHHSNKRVSGRPNGCCAIRVSSILRGIRHALSCKVSTA